MGKINRRTIFDNTKIVRVEIKSKVFDSRAAQKLKSLKKTEFGEKISNLQLVDVYTIDKELTHKQLKLIGESLSNPVFQIFSLRFIKPEKFDWAIEIGFLPGVTDNVAYTAKEIIEDKLKVKFRADENIYTSQIFFITGNLNNKEAVLLAEGLINPLIQRVHVKSSKEFIEDNGMDKIIPKVILSKKNKVTEINLHISDQELIEIGKKGIQNTDGTRRGPLALDLTYLKTIQNYFKKLGRNPTDIELESIAQTWSEHCKHTIFADPIDEIKHGLFKTYIKGATEKIRKQNGKKDFCVSVFTDNSGAIEFDRKYLVTHKVETHNSQVALSPFGGSVTGIVGVNRDAIGFGMGAKPIVNTYGFCFPHINDKRELFKDVNLSQKLPSTQEIILGMVEGVNYGGNTSGIPTPQGFIYFDDSFRGKPLVYVGTVGLIPKQNGKKKLYLKKAKKEDYIVMVGGKVGLDGIHGATFSSESLNVNSPSSAVQIGDPITQKKLSDAIVKEIRDLNLYSSITDNGAGGLSCSVAEMAKESNGCLVDLDQVPLKYPGLAPWQIWISESQERMTLSVPKNKWKKLENILDKQGVEATTIGKFTNSGRCVVRYKGKIIMNLGLNFLHNGLPKRNLVTKKPAMLNKDVLVPKYKNYTKVFNKLLSFPNITSSEFISSQYDHEVQGGSVLKPLQGKGLVNCETTVIRPVLDSNKGIVLSQGLYPRYSEIDPYHMAGCAIDTAIKNSVATGANPDIIALLDNFCWCSSNDPERLWQLKQAVKGCFDFAVGFKTPFISGKDSMFNDFVGFDQKRNPLKISVLPTLLISSIGVIDDISKVVSLDFKFPGDLIYILGETNEQLGGSEYYSLWSKNLGKTAPKVNVEKNRKLYKSFYIAVQKDLITSSIGINRGGLGVALAKSAIGGLLGVEVDLKNLPGNLSRDDFALFSESTGRILVSINPKNKKAFEKILKGNVFAQIGLIKEDNEFIVKGAQGDVVINDRVDNLKKSYKKTFQDY